MSTPAELPAGRMPGMDPLGVLQRLEGIHTSRRHIFVMEKRFQGGEKMKKGKRHRFQVQVRLIPHL